MGAHPLALAIRFIVRGYVPRRQTEDDVQMALDMAKIARATRKFAVKTEKTA